MFGRYWFILIHVTYFSLCFSFVFLHRLGFAAHCPWIHPDIAHSSYTMPDTYDSTLTKATQSDMEDSPTDSISLQGLHREMDDLKESIEYAHQNNIRTQTQVGNIQLQSQTMND